MLRACFCPIEEYPFQFSPSVVTHLRVDPVVYLGMCYKSLFYSILFCIIWRQKKILFHLQTVSFTKHLWVIETLAEWINTILLPLAVLSNPENMCILLLVLFWGMWFHITTLMKTTAQNEIACNENSGICVFHIAFYILPFFWELISKNINIIIEHL